MSITMHDKIGEIFINQRICSISFNKTIFVTHNVAMLFLAHLAVSTRRACGVYRVTNACRGKAGNTYFTTDF